MAAAVLGTLETGVPNPQSARGRAARLSNVVTCRSTSAEASGRLVEWARSIDAYRVDLGAMPQGQRIYERAGFRLTSATRMKLPLENS